MRCPDLFNLSPAERASYVKQLVYFRLFIWLLQRPNVHHCICQSFMSQSKSLLGQQARLGFLWQLSSSITALHLALLNPDADMVSRLPDVRYKRWLQYRLDRIADYNGDLIRYESAIELLQMIQTYWSHIPPPVHGLHLYVVHAALVFSKSFRDLNRINSMTWI